MRVDVTAGVPDPTAALVGVVEDPDVEPAEVARALRELFACDPALATSTALGILSRSPRYQPSRGLLVDPGDTAFRRWGQRVAACRELVGSPALPGVFDEVLDELSDSPELARDVLLDAPVSAALDPRRRAVLAALRPPPTA